MKRVILNYQHYPLNDSWTEYESPTQGDCLGDVSEEDYRYAWVIFRLGLVENPTSDSILIRRVFVRPRN